MINLESIVTSAKIEVVLWTTDDLLCAYDATLSLWEERGWTPQRVAGIKPSRPGYYDAFDESRRYPTAQHIQESEGITIEALAHNWRTNAEWIARVDLSNRYGKGYASQVVDEAALGESPDIIHDVHQRFLALIPGQYAYIVRQQRRYVYNDLALTTFTGALMKQPRDRGMNTSWWSMEYPRSVDGRLLRDIYPHNFLNQAYLDAPAGFSGLSLREWIEADPSERGVLKPFTDTLTEWTPPVEHIPKIREALFRGGRVFYWRFFSPTRRHEGERPYLPDGSKNPNLMEPEPFHRPDLLAPWESPEPIPEIFWADYYKDKDPGLIY